MKLRIWLFLTLCLVGLSPTYGVEPSWPQKVHYRYTDVLGQKIFYRESGESNRPTIVLLHGYPSSSHAYRELIPLLSGRYHIIAPDHIGSGFSDKPDPKNFEYSFDVLARYVDGLLNKLDVDKYILYMQDFGAPVGFRLMMMKPDHVEAVIAQNANAYMEGIPPAKQAFFRAAQLDQSPENVSKLFAFTSPEAVKHKQYLRDVKDRPDVMSPDTWTHDGHFLSTDRERRIQLRLFQDYKTNLDNYPNWQKFMRKQQLPVLLAWGKHDPVFTAAGAHAYLQDVPNAEIHLLDAGHFAVEEKAVEIAKLITAFLGYKTVVGTISQQTKDRSK
ncbi:MAG: alpha/beta fold hydrolase [Ectothiorhodospiraceae bacterium]|nr:alpha/beta fold hydrolase [Ectothiorhodospiraceae bacterium]